MKSVVEQGFFNKFPFNNKALKTFVEFWICRIRSKFERCQTRHSREFSVRRRQQLLPKRH